MPCKIVGYIDRVVEELTGSMEYPGLDFSSIGLSIYDGELKGYPGIYSLGSRTEGPEIAIDSLISPGIYAVRLLTNDHTDYIPKKWLKSGTKIIQHYRDNSNKLVYSPVVKMLLQ